ncbi:TRAP transporter small permease [Chloroflexota bacterium]
MVLIFIGGAVLATMMLLTGMDVLLRYVFSSPIVGAYELTEFMLLLAVFLGLAYTQRQKAHITVDLVISRLSKKGQAILNSVTYFISLGLLILISWQIVLTAVDELARKHVSTTLAVPVFPFMFTAAFATIVFCLVLIIDFVHFIHEGIRN